MYIVRKRIQKKQFKSMIKITYGSNLIQKKNLQRRPCTGDKNFFNEQI